MRTAVIALVTLVVGFALGWSLRPVPTPVVEAPPEPVVRTETRVVTKTVTRPDHRVGQLTADRAAAEETIEALEAQLAEARAVAAQLEGEPITWPADVPARFTEPAFLVELNRAIAKEKLPGEVSGLDCTEFPCIAHGRLELDHPRDRAKLERLFAAMKARYPGADFYLSQTVYSEDPNGDDPAQQRFSMSFYPPETDEGRRRALNVRLRSRKNAYVDAE